jgi:protein-disulfide isomerase
MPNRRQTASLLAVLAAFGPPALAQTRRPVTTDDMVMGRADAPVTVVEYASVGCPHCARFAADVFPAFKRRYIDTGQVKFVMREMLNGNANLAGVGFLLARCAGQDKYFEVVDAIFHALPRWMEDNKYNEGLTQIAQSAGLSTAEMNACVRDPAAVDALNARVVRNRAIDKVSATPTFVVNGVKAEGEQTLEQLDALIAAAKARLAGGAG